MTKKIERLKTHFKENKKFYIGVTVGLVIGSAGTLYFANKVEVTQKAQNIALLNWKPFTHLEQTTILHLPARGHRGFAIINDRTKEPYGSVREAARKIGCSPSVLREHLAGLRPNIDGETYTNLGENLSEQIKIPA